MQDVGPSSRSWSRGSAFGSIRQRIPGRRAGRGLPILPRSPSRDSRLDSPAGICRIGGHSGFRLSGPTLASGTRGGRRSHFDQEPEPGCPRPGGNDSIREGVVRAGSCSLETDFGRSPTPGLRKPLCSLTLPFDVPTFVWCGASIAPARPIRRHSVGKKTVKPSDRQSPVY